MRQLRQLGDARGRRTVLEPQLGVVAHSRCVYVAGVLRIQGRFEPIGNGYRPKTGDTVLYDNEFRIGQHTNFVVAVDGDTATTVGGNELGKIRVHDLDWLSDGAVVGFGRLDS